jgi:hypothetical protein
MTTRQYFFHLSNQQNCPAAPAAARNIHANLDDRNNKSGSLSDLRQHARSNMSQDLKLLSG